MLLVNMKLYIYKGWSSWCGGARSSPSIQDGWRTPRIRTRVPLEDTLFKPSSFTDIYPFLTLWLAKWAHLFISSPTDLSPARTWALRGSPGSGDTYLSASCFQQWLQFRITWSNDGFLLLFIYFWRKNNIKNALLSPDGGRARRANWGAWRSEDWR